jgi:hypothetical protein
MEQEQKMSFPKLDLHDLKDVWMLGNMARSWAAQPLALSSDDLQRYQDLCHRYGLAPAEVLHQFQTMVFVGPEMVPVTDRGSGPRPSPHPRHEADRMQQSGVVGVDYPPDGGHFLEHGDQDPGHWEPGSGEWHVGLQTECVSSVCKASLLADQEHSV